MSQIITSIPQPYVYSPLAEDEIRILELFPVSSYGLRCNLRVHKLEEIEFKYEAVSYAWGPPNLTEQLRVGFDGEHGYLKVTQVVKDMLHSVRDQTYTRHLWIDALCINQTDIDEKSHQVQRMGKIYGDAERVLVWLGKDNPEVKEVVEALGRFWNWRRTGSKPPLERTFILIRHMLDSVPWFRRC